MTFGIIDIKINYVALISHFLLHFFLDFWYEIWNFWKFWNKKKKFFFYSCNIKCDISAT